MALGKYVLIGPAVIGLAVIAGVLVSRLPPEARSYKGKSVHGWTLQAGSTDPRLREEAASAFKALGSNAVPGLVRLLGYRDSWVRERLWALAPSSPTLIQQTVLKWLRPPQAAQIHLAAVRSLGTIGPEAAGAVPALAGELRAGDADLRWNAGMALANIGPAGVRGLTAALASPNSNVCYAAISGLGAAGPAAEAAVPALLPLLADPNDGLRIAAGGSLARIGTNALSWVIRELEAPNGTNRLCAAKALPILRPDRARVLPALFDMARDPEPGCRLVALQTLGVLGIPNDQMMEVFLHATADPANEVKLTAIPLLAQARWNLKPVVPRLIACLGDASAPVRETAARTLGTMGVAAKPAVPALEQSAADPDGTASAAAQDALSRIAKAEAAEAASAFLPAPGEVR